MKHIKILIVVAVFFAFNNCFAQDNTIKVGLSDAVLGNFNLSYEKVVNEKGTFQFKIGYWQPTLSPFISENTITPEAYTMQEMNGGINASVEYRFYLEDNAPSGLYIAPYLRYFNQSAIYTDEIDNNYFDVDTKLNTIGVGAQIGYQLVVNEAFTMDFYFFGAGVDNHSLKLKYELQQAQSGFDYNTITDDVSEVFEDINYLEKRLEHDVSSSNLLSKLPFLFPGFRLGVSMGFAF